MDQSNFTSAVARKRADRSVSHEALTALEAVLEAPAPGREGEWRQLIINTLDVFIAALDEQAAHNRSDDSLLSQIAYEQPRFEPLIRQLEDELDQLRAAERLLRDQITRQQTEPEIDYTHVRSRLGDLDAKYRLLRARETDLVYEATSVDIGGKG